MVCGADVLILPADGALHQAKKLGDVFWHPSLMASYQLYHYQDILLDQVYEERMDNTVLIDRHPADYEPLIH